MQPAEGAPHVLYVAWGFPPCRGGGVYRALATANAFARQGFRVTVLTADRETFLRFTGVDSSMEALVDPRIDIVRIPFEWPTLETDVRRWSAFRGLMPKVWRRVRIKLDKLPFPEVGYGPWRKPLEAAATRIHQSDPVDLVVASANPNVDFMVADRLYRDHNVPYVMDYRDAWMLDVFDGDLVHKERSRVSRLERRLVSGAREVWFVNEPIRSWHQRRYPDAAKRMHVVANGYDPEFAPVPRATARDTTQPLTFGYIGTISTKVPLGEFADGWQIARDRSAELAGATAQIWGYLGYYSTPHSGLLKIVEDHAQAGLEYAGPLPKSMVRDAYENFDAVLLILGKGRYVTSGKVFEYTASALPIVSVHDPDNAASDVLRDYPLWFPVRDLQPESVAMALEQAALAARTASTEVREQCRLFSEQYARDLQLLPRTVALDHGLAGREPAGPPMEHAS
jgi:glycosyltransferase involved in cell wall biosynthesis